MRETFTAIKIFIQRIYHIIWSSIVAFTRNEDSLKASALTYYTLISIVPFLAVAFGIATGFGFEQYLEEQLTETFSEQEEIIKYAIQFARSLLQNAKGSVIAGVGVITLLWTNISMLGSIENALNDIWHARQSRSWAKKLVDYLAVMIIGPIVIVVSSSLSVFLMSQLTRTASENHLVEIMSPFLVFMLKLIPFLLCILLFVMVYLFIPNVRVQAKPRFIAGILAGIAFQLWQWIYIKFQVEVSSYGAIYGTFAALPLFLIWLQVSWLIVLFGAEIAANIENEAFFIEKQGSKGLVDASPKELGLVILSRCIKAFTNGTAAPSSLTIAKELSLPLQTAQQMIDILVDSDILTEVMFRDNSRIGYLPCKDARLITVQNVCDAIEKQMGWTVKLEDSSILEQVEGHLNAMHESIAKSKANVTMQQLSEEEG